MSSASSESGTTCAASAFMRSEGIVHSFLVKSNSAPPRFGHFGFGPTLSNSDVRYPTVVSGGD